MISYVSRKFSRDPEAEPSKSKPGESAIARRFKLERKPRKPQAETARAPAGGASFAGSASSSSSSSRSTKPK